jgi:glycoprotein-N-acetylgalactosamine 3-beta-galactosyltransferase
MENIRYLLSQFHPQTSLYIGNKFAIRNALDGYMAGGGYILSKKALEKFVTKILPNPEMCRADNGGSEDLEMGKCLQHDALIVDGRDNLSQQRFFPIGVEYPMKKSIKKSKWYENYEWFNVTRGSIACCSDTVAQMHYIKPTEMHFLEYLIYHLHPFGLQKNLTEKIPAKLTLQQVIESADKESSAPNYKKHKISHNIDVDERYRRRK